MLRRSLAMALVAGAVLLSPTGAEARDFPQNNGSNGFDLQLFRPAIDTKGYLTVNASQVLGLWDVSFGLVGTLAASPLHLADPGNGVNFHYDFLLTPSLQFALGFKYAELAVTLPVQIGFGGADPRFVKPGDAEQNVAFSYSGQGLGDLGVHIKARILNTSKHPVGLAILASAYLPIMGDGSKNFLSDGAIGIMPQVIVDRDFGRTRRLRGALNLGARIRTAPHTFTDSGLKGLMQENARLGIDCGPVATMGTPMCGTGLSRELGTQITYGLGLSYAVIKEKLDLLGELYGAVGFTANSQPLEAVVGVKIYLAKNSFMSIGGGASLIPNQTQGALWRGFLGFVFEPAIGDRDGDGIKDDVDKCPDDPEDKDDFQDDDGCPDPDNDQDGILDVDDKDPVNGRSCANDPEDKDGFEDEDGCPDPDNDKDRILDVDDKCPNEPETYNGVDDKDGCPDRGRVIVRKGKIEILDKIFFETDKAIILPVSFPLLDAISATLIGSPELALVEIQGHADERATPEHNLKLTKDRAEAVRTYLIEHKDANGKTVEANRLKAVGFGATRPICKEHNEDCWSKNRRVEFLILKRIEIED